MRLGGAYYIIARGWWRRGALAFEAGDAADDNLTDGRKQHSIRDLRSVITVAGFATRSMAVFCLTCHVRQSSVPFPSPHVFITTHTSTATTVVNNNTLHDAIIAAVGRTTDRGDDHLIQHRTTVGLYLRN